ncbi:MAG: asparagine synthase (glutamine-hydrolyzing) [Verrucomicrobia bacterium]|nr:asparagine synthase (glutamine-hydrolyzing) [Verrucomicrobiota bacterium]
MCGIAGFVSLRHPASTREAALARMLAAQRQRGPDDEGSITQGPATLGMRRLAVFDPANGHQPMISPDGRHHLVFNGAIYNFRPLRSAYAQRGWVFRTGCDTEVLLAALALDGVAVLPGLRGMFAFAWWDAREKTLLLVRDALGIKPLLYHIDPVGPLLFASESRALLASRHVPGELDPAAADDFLRWQSVPAPRTLHAGVRSLRPGEQLRWHDGRSEVSAWWTPAACLATARRRPGLPPPAASAAELQSQLRARLEDSIQAHIAADVPVGAFLSGGLDSAIITALMARQVGPDRVQTFSIGFEENAFSETAEAAATARHLGVAHHTHILTGAAVAGDLDNILATLDQPTGDGLNTYYAARFARAGGITVALSGLGADELFGGYPAFRRLPTLARWLPRWALIPAPLQRTLLGLLDARGTAARKLADTLRLGDDLTDVALAQRQVFSTREISRLLAPAASSQASSNLLGYLRPGSRLLHPAAPEIRAAWEAALSSLPPSTPAPLALLASLAETRGYMADVLLRDADEFSMRHSLELRVPFLDLPLVEWAWAQNPSLLHPAGAAPKSVLAAACADLLPPALLNRQKRGFTLPFARWLRGPLRPFMEDTLGSASVGRCGLFDPYAAGKLWRAYRDGSDDRAWSCVWSLAVLIHLANRRMS